MAEAVPIHKPGTEKIATNYRPISLVSNTAKVSENIVYLRLLNFLMTATQFQICNLDLEKLMLLLEWQVSDCVFSYTQTYLSVNITNIFQTTSSFNFISKGYS